jgi:hypothetical protein
MGTIKGPNCPGCMERPCRCESAVEAPTLATATPAELRAALRAKCKHSNTFVRREGMTGMLGTVICRDCGYEREWNAY